jgi:hypothetical protein
VIDCHETALGFTVRAREQGAEEDGYEFAAYSETSPYSAPWGGCGRRCTADWQLATSPGHPGAIGCCTTASGVEGPSRAGGSSLDCGIKSSGDGFAPRHRVTRPWKPRALLARFVRVEFGGAVYRVTARGNERKPIFRDERDRPVRVRKYLSQCLSADAEARSAWRAAIAACALSVLGRSASPTTTPPLTAPCSTIPKHDTSPTGFEYQL